MSRYGDADLPSAPKGYANKLSREFKFETAGKAADDDADRAKRLKRYAEAGGRKADPALALGKRFERDKAPESVVSRRFMREYRASVTYALVCLVQDPALPEAKVATVMPEYWEIEANAEELVQKIPKLVKSLGKMIERLCPAQPHGYLYGWLDFDFAPAPDRFRPHMHLVASGDYLEAVHELRNNPLISLVPLVSYSNEDRRPVQIKRITPGTEARALSYIPKSAWFQKEVIVEGKRTKGPKRAIPEPYHSEVLLALHQLKLRDFILKRGLSVTAAGLRVTRP